MNRAALPKARRARCSWLHLPTPTLVPPTVSGDGKRWLILALLGGYLCFCHGCHGGEDNELFLSLCRQKSPPLAKGGLEHDRALHPD